MSQHTVDSNDLPISSMFPPSWTSPEGFLCPRCYVELSRRAAGDIYDITREAARLAMLDLILRAMIRKEKINEKHLHKIMVDAFKDAFKEQKDFLKYMRPVRSRSGRGKGGPNEPRSDLSRFIKELIIKRVNRSKAISLTANWISEHDEAGKWNKESKLMKYATQRVDYWYSPDKRQPKKNLHK